MTNEERQSLIDDLLKAAKQIKEDGEELEKWRIDRDERAKQKSEFFAELERLRSENIILKRRNRLDRIQFGRLS